MTEDGGKANEEEVVEELFDKVEPSLDLDDIDDDAEDFDDDDEYIYDEDDDE
jgi:hypothetical protein